MRSERWVNLLLSVLFMAGLMSCGSDETKINIQEVLSQPKTYVGSGECKYCHLEHYDSWKTTLHSRTLTDVTQNRDALIVEINPDTIRADLQTHKAQLKLPLDEIYIPRTDEIKYTMGMQWKQSFLVEKNGKLYVAPIQYNAKAEHWVSYHEEDWDKRPWNEYCGGCHAMGVDLEKNTFSETSVGCEACHGPGSRHVALPETAVYDKRSTIINPSQLPVGFRTQICGSCHNRGKSTRMPDIEWPVGYQPGRALGLYYKSASFAAGDVKHFYANEFAKGHHQQYLDWQQSAHAAEGVTCTSCHYVHQLGVAPTQYQTRGAGSQQCLMCHVVINNNASHSIHSFANCIGCHMPKIAKSAESGDTHSHAFTTLMPKDTLKNPAVPNSCQTCHKHKDTDLATLQKVFDGLAQKSLLRVHQVR